MVHRVQPKLREADREEQLSQPHQREELRPVQVIIKNDQCNLEEAR